MKKKKKKMSFRNNPVKVRYYGMNCIKSGMPKVTVAIGVVDGVVCRGLALCSHSEIKATIIKANPDGGKLVRIKIPGKGYVEKEGKDIAKRRLFRAFNRGKDTKCVLREEAISVAKSVRCPSGSGQEEFFSFKSAFDVVPTTREATLLRG